MEEGCQSSGPSDGTLTIVLWLLWAVTVSGPKKGESTKESNIIDDNLPLGVVVEIQP